MSAERELLGAWGEAAAAQYLREHRYRILGMRYSCRFGEIDIIAQNRKYIAFVEVKLRKSDRYGQPREYVDWRKQDRIRMTASIYLEQNPTRLQPRFDVIEIYAPEGVRTEHPVINHLEDAFQ